LKGNLISEEECENIFRYLSQLPTLMHTDLQDNYAESMKLKIEENKQIYRKFPLFFSLSFFFFLKKN